MRILCGTDFSPSAAGAATVAALLARKSGGQLHLIHALPDGGAPADGGDKPAALEREAARLGAFEPGLTSGLVDGPADRAMLGEAARLGSTLIVLGDLGRSVTDHWRLGSVAGRVAREAPVPVLVVRSPAPLMSWLEDRHPLAVLVGHEPGESSDAALRWAVSLAALGRLELSIVRLVVPGIENRRSGARGEGIGLELRPDVEAGLLDALREEVEPHLQGLPVRLSVLPALGRRDMPLVMAAETAGGGLLVVGSHQRRGFRRWWTGSVASGVLNAASMSVAVVPHKAPDS